MKWKCEVEIQKEVTDDKVHILLTVKTGLNKDKRYEKELHVSNGSPTAQGQLAVMVRVIQEFVHDMDIIPFNT